MAFYNALTGVGSRAIPAVTTYFANWAQKPIVLPIDPWMAGMVQVFPGAKLITEIPISIHSGRLVPWEGRWVFGGRSSGMLRVSRGAMTIGAHATIIGPSSEIDFTGWNQQPDSISTTIGNNPPLAFAYMLNGAYSGTAKDESGNAVDIQGIAPCVDQIYGGPLGAPVANVNTIAITSGGTLKPANPADPSILSGGAAGWYNAWSTHDGTNPNNYLPVLENLNMRPAHNGVPMMLAAKQTLKMLVSPSKYERNRVLFTVMEQLANSGVFGQVEYTATGAATPTVVYGSQPNPMYGRLVIEPVPGLRPDLRVLCAPCPPAYPQLQAFLYAHGGTGAGEYKIQENANDPNNNSVPHIYVRAFDTNSSLYDGALGLPAGTIGMAWIINEGFAFASGALMEFLYDGAPS